MSALTEAIAAHKAAWQAFQDAPADEKHQDTIAASDREDEAEFDLIRTVPLDQNDLAALEAHLDWWVDEEAQRQESRPELFALHAGIRLAKVAGRIERRGTLYFPEWFLFALGALHFVAALVAGLLGSPSYVSNFSGAGSALLVMWAIGERDAA